MNSLPQLCCPRCGSLDIIPDMPDFNTNKMLIFCPTCREVSEINVKIDGIGEDGKLKITAFPNLIMQEKNKDRTKKLYF